MHCLVCLFNAIVFIAVNCAVLSET
jgi:hypothetical protein